MADKVQVRIRANGTEVATFQIEASIVTMQTSQGTSGPRYVRALPEKSPLNADEVIVDFTGDPRSVVFTKPAPA